MTSDKQQNSNKTKYFKFTPDIHNTRNVSRLIQPDQNTFIVEPETKCRREKSNDSKMNKTLLLIMVCSAVQNSKKRKLIRETWAKDTNWFHDVKVIFMLGNTPDPLLQNSIFQEAVYYQDIVQSSHLDTYADLAIKSLMLLKWFLLFCKGTSSSFMIKSQFQIVKYNCTCKCAVIGVPRVFTVLHGHHFMHAE